MATKEQQTKTEPVISLTPSEMKLIALGVRFTDLSGKIDYEKIAKYGSYTKGSAQVLYRKAHRKLLDAFPINEEAASENGPNGSSNPSTPAAKSTKTARGARGSTGKKRNAAEDNVVDITTPDAPGPEVAPTTPAGMESIVVDTETPTKPPAKRQRKTPQKKPVFKSEPSVKEEELATEEENAVVGGDANESITVKDEPGTSEFTTMKF